MDNRARAEKILDHEDIDMLWDYDDALEFTIAQLDEAVREATEETIKAYKAGTARGFAAGIEKAAMLIEDWHVRSKGGTHSMAFAIRALKADR